MTIKPTRQSAHCPGHPSNPLPFTWCRKLWLIFLFGNEHVWIKNTTHFYSMVLLTAWQNFVPDKHEKERYDLTFFLFCFWWWWLWWWWWCVCVCEGRGGGSDGSGCCLLSPCWCFFSAVDALYQCSRLKTMFMSFLLPSLLPLSIPA